jgi:hypothetical protein
MFMRDRFLFTIQDARWDTERLSGLAYDVDSSFAGIHRACAWLL